MNKNEQEKIMVLDIIVQYSSCSIAIAALRNLYGRVWVHIL